MLYGKPPFSHLNMIQKLQTIIDFSYPIEFPKVDNPFLLDVIQSCLTRETKKRPTIPELLQHPFLRPDFIIAQEMGALSRRY